MPPGERTILVFKALLSGLTRLQALLNMPIPPRAPLSSRPSSPAHPAWALRARVAVWGSEWQEFNVPAGEVSAVTSKNHSLLRVFATRLRLTALGRLAAAHSGQGRRRKPLPEEFNPLFGSVTLNVGETAPVFVPGYHVAVAADREWEREPVTLGEISGLSPLLRDLFKQCGMRRKRSGGEIADVEPLAEFLGRMISDTAAGTLVLAVPTVLPPGLGWEDLFEMFGCQRVVLGDRLYSQAQLTAKAREVPEGQEVLMVILSVQHSPELDVPSVVREVESQHPELLVALRFPSLRDPGVELSRWSPEERETGDTVDLFLEGMTEAALEEVSLETVADWARRVEALPGCGRLAGPITQLLDTLRRWHLGSVQPCCPLGALSARERVWLGVALLEAQPFADCVVILECSDGAVVAEDCARLQDRGHTVILCAADPGLLPVSPAVHIDFHPWPSSSLGHSSLGHSSSGQEEAEEAVSAELRGVSSYSPPPVTASMEVVEPERVLLGRAFAEYRQAAGTVVYLETEDDELLGRWAGTLGEGRSFRWWGSEGRVATIGSLTGLDLIAAHAWSRLPESMAIGLVENDFLPWSSEKICARCLDRVGRARQPRECLPEYSSSSGERCPICRGLWFVGSICSVREGGLSIADLWHRPIADLAAREIFDSRVRTVVFRAARVGLGAYTLASPIAQLAEPDRVRATLLRLAVGHAGGNAKMRATVRRTRSRAAGPAPILVVGRHPMEGLEALGQRLVMESAREAVARNPHLALVLAGRPLKYRDQSVSVVRFGREGGKIVVG